MLLTGDIAIITCTFHMVCHVEPIINSHGDSIRATFPFCKRANLRTFFNGNYIVKVIRPTMEYTSREQLVWLDTVNSKVGKPFNWFRKLNNCVCPENFWTGAEVALEGLHSIGRYEALRKKEVTPYVFEILANSTDFEIIYQSKYPRNFDFEKLLGPVSNLTFYWN